jgi:hypothetical protein
MARGMPRGESCVNCEIKKASEFDTQINGLIHDILSQTRPQIEGNRLEKK